MSWNDWNTNRYAESGNATALEFLLLGDLRDLLDQPESIESNFWLQALLDRLIVTMATLCDEESHDEYLEFVRERFPNWTPKVEQLHYERWRLFVTLKSLRARWLEHHETISSLLPGLRRDLQAWMARLQTHRYSENGIMQMAALLDVGAGD